MKPHIILHEFRTRAATLLFFLAVFFISSALLAAPNVSVTKTASAPASNPDGTSKPGDTINYTVGISNSGAAGTTDATGVQLTDTIDSNSTFVNGSDKVSANAIAHSYNAAGNTQLTVTATNNGTTWTGGLLVGVHDIDGVTSDLSLGVTAGTVATSAGGSVTITNNGSFTYTPQVGDQNLNDTFSYTVTDGDGLVSTGLVTIALGARVWYVDSTYGGANGASDGSNTRPFTTLSSVSNGGAGGNTLASNDIIFIIERAGDYDGNVTLLSGQQLYGSGAALTVNTIVINAAGGSNTTWVTTAASTSAITLNSGNTVKGFTIGNTTGSKILGSSFGTLTISNVTLQGSGQALNLTNGTASGTIDSLSSTSGTNNIALTTVSGTLTINGGAISGATGAAFLVSGSNPTVSYSGTITQNNAGRVVDIQGTTGGAITVSGTITGGSSNTGIHIGDTTVVAGNVSFTTVNLGTSGSRMASQAVTMSGSGTFTLGTISIFTSSAQGVVASNASGGINITTGTVDATSQRAINIAGTSAASKVTLAITLTSVLSTSSPTNGITLQNTAGTFHIVGNSGTCTTGTPTCTGGSIQSTTAEGILLNTAAGISFAFMKVQNSGTDGIAATSVNGFTLDNSIVTDTAGVSGDEGIQFNNVSGTVTISNSTINGAPHNGIQLTNNNTNLAAFNLTNSTISNNGVGNLVGNDGLLFVTQGTTTVTAATVSGCTFTNILATSLQPQTQDTSTITNFTVTGNSFSHQNIAFDGDVSQASHLTTTIGGPNPSDINTFTFTTGPDIINLDSATTSTSGATLTAKVQNNTIGTQGTNDSGGGGAGVRVAIQGATHGVVRIDNNRINEIPNGSGIKVFAVTGTGGANVEVINNTMPKPTGTSIDPGCGHGVTPCPTNTVDLEALNSNSMCAIVTGNSAWDPESFTDGAGQSAYFLLQNNPAIFNLEGTGTAATYIAAHNTVTNSSGGTADVQVFGTVNTVAAGTCGSFPLYLDNRVVVPASTAACVDSSDRRSGSGDSKLAPASPAVSARVEPEPPTILPISGSMPMPPARLSASDLASVVAAAKLRWIATGLTNEQVAALDKLHFSLGDLPRLYLGQAGPNEVKLDTNAAGKGWFVD
ncbi:MAG TPA: Ig-like domain-containing protein, partial [Chthoniobacterales bacterium]